MRAIMISILGFLVIVSISCCVGNSNVLCIESERQALLKLKHDLIDPSNRLSSWIQDTDCCKWLGILCNNFTGHVMELHLGFPPPSIDDDESISDEWELSRLGGKINPSLLNLKYLSFLDLSYMDLLEMQIPKFIGSLTSLTHLAVHSANFGKEIPHNIANLSKLQYLDLGGNFFRAAKNLELEWVSGLSSLQYLDLSFLDLSEATEWQEVINKLPCLVELHLSGCSLNNAPYSPVINVNHTSTLALLDLSFNTLSAVPSWIFNLNSLVSLDLSINRFEGAMPSGFQNMSSLKNLDLIENSFSSSIPNWLSRLNHLQSLDLSSNRLQGNIPSGIGKLGSLTQLHLSDNMLEGILLVPKSLESFCSLREMDLSYNKIDQGILEISESLSRCSFKTLESLKLASNKFFGHLPDQLGKFKNLAYLYLSNNSISGPIPFSIGKLSLLKELDFSCNQLVSSLPQSLGQLENLEFLDLSNNMFEGIVSEMHFSNLTRLTTFKASNNKLTFQPNPNWIPPFHCQIIELGNWYTGPQFPVWLRFQNNFSVLDHSHGGISDVIPTWFWNLSTQFNYVNLSHNQLVGGISYWPEIRTLDLRSNQFTGPLPQVSPLSTFLFLSRNLFSGSLSHFLCGIQMGLQILDLGSNLLSGKIPDCWENWPYLNVLNLENNNLTGGIPKSLGSLRYITSLNLRKNNLFGKVSSHLQHLASLRILDISGNQFSGSIPAWIGDKLLNLVVLNLRSNNFQSKIPGKICALDYLHVLDFGSNNISGAIPKCFSNLTAMTKKIFDTDLDIPNWEFISGYLYVYAASLVLKGREDVYGNTLGLVTSIDLSANSLTGDIPKELGNLKGLLSLNLSGNALKGKIPESIGKMESLESLDLSMNKLHGEIPSSLSSLNFLNHFNLSYNNLTGPIPSGTQLQSFDESSFIGNHLCGPPVTKNCSARNNVTNEGSNGGGSKWLKVNGLYVSIVLGFVMGFWGVMAPLFFIRSWRLFYYRKLEHIGDKLYVLWATSAAKLFQGYKFN